MLCWLVDDPTTITLVAALFSETIVTRSWKKK